MLKERKRVLEQLHQKRLKLSWDAVPHEKLVYAVHRERAEVSRVVCRISSALAAKVGKMEDGVEDAGGDQARERHPAEEVS